MTIPLRLKNEYLNLIVVMHDHAVYDSGVCITAHSTVIALKYSPRKGWIIVGKSLA